jgi:hypothetical protein
MTMSEEVRVLAKKQYGRWVYYPVCDKAKALADIAGTKTLTEDVLYKAMQIGLRIDVQDETPKFV